MFGAYATRCPDTASLSDSLSPPCPSVIAEELARDTPRTRLRKVKEAQLMAEAATAAFTAVQHSEEMSETRTSSRTVASSLVCPCPLVRQPFALAAICFQCALLTRGRDNRSSAGCRLAPRAPFSMRSGLPAT